MDPRLRSFTNRDERPSPAKNDDGDDGDDDDEDGDNAREDDAAPASGLVIVAMLMAALPATLLIQ